MCVLTSYTRSGELLSYRIIYKVKPRYSVTSNIASSKKCLFDDSLIIIEHSQ
jgi:hypothetical protein